MGGDVVFKQKMDSLDGTCTSCLQLIIWHGAVRDTLAISHFTWAQVSCDAVILGG